MPLARRGGQSEAAMRDPQRLQVQPESQVSRLSNGNFLLEILPMKVEIPNPLAKARVMY